MKNFLKKVGAVILTLALTLTSTGIAVLANAATPFTESIIGTKQSMYISYYNYSYNFGGSGLGTLMWGQIVKMNVGSSTGQIAYCIDSMSNAGSGGAKYTYSATNWYRTDLTYTQQEYIKRALVYGYKGTTKYGYSADTERLATQIIIWDILDGWFNAGSNSIVSGTKENTAFNCFTATMGTTLKANVKTVYQKIKTQIINHKVIPSFSANEKGLAKTYTLKYQSDGTYSLTLSDSKSVAKFFDWASAIKESKLTGLTITTNSNGGITVKSTKPITTTTVIHADKTKNTYANSIDCVMPVALEVGSGQGGQQNGVSTYQDADPVQSYFKLKTEGVGTQKVVKVTTGNKYISGIQFTLKGTSDNGLAISRTATTNSSGVATFGSVPVGTYKVAEVTSTVNTTLYNTAASRTVTVKANTTSTINMTNNEKVGNLTVTKSTPGNKNISGIQFTLSGQSSTGRTIKLYATTNTSGIAKFTNVPIGTYSVAEVSSTVKTNLYNVASSKNITITNGTTKTITFTNTEKTGFVHLIKKTPAGNMNVKGIKFTLSGTTNTGRAFTISGTTNDNGEIMFSNIPLGTYTVKEDSGTVDTTKYNIASNKSVTVALANNSYADAAEVNELNTYTTGKLVVNKVLRDIDGNTVSDTDEYNGITFKVYSTTLKRWIQGTGSNGVYTYKENGTTPVTDKANATAFTINSTTHKLTLSGIPSGNYKVYEVTGADGYSFDADSSDDVTITKGATKELKVYNDEVEVYNGHLQIVKHFIEGSSEGDIDVTEYTNAISQVKFKVILHSNGETYGVKVKGENGSYVYTGLSDSGSELSLCTDKTSSNYSTIDITKLKKTRNDDYYEIIETSNSSIYKLDASSSNLTVVVPDDDKVVSVVNNKTEFGTLNINKTLANIDGTTVPSGEIYKTISFVLQDTTSEKWCVFNEENELTGYTDSISKATKLFLTETTTSVTAKKLPYSDYSVYETSGANGYSYSTSAYNCSVTNKTPVNINITNNEIPGTLNVHKILANTDTDYSLNADSLSQIEFTLKTADGKYLELTGDNGVYAFNGYTTEENSLSLDTAGDITVTNLPKGDYIANEISGADNYEFSSEDIEITINYGKTSYATVVNSLMRGNLRITKTSNDGVIAGFSFNVTAILFDGTEYNETFITDENGEIFIENLVVGTYTVSEVINDMTVGYITPENQTVVIEHESDSSVVMHNTKISGNIKLEKVDSTDPEVLLSGATYTIYDNNMTSIGTLDETSKGIYEVTDIIYGTYYVKETVAPEGYLIDKDTYKLPIIDNGETLVITNAPDESGKFYESPITGGVEITKTDVSTGELIPNCGIQILDSNKNVLFKDKTDENGIVTFDELEYGDYFYQEYEAPTGYIIDTKAYPFSVQENGTIVKCEMTNKLITGDVEITKTDISTGELIPNCGIEILDSEQNSIIKGKTDENGVVVFSNLDYGNYYYREYEAPEGYVIDTKPYAFSITENGVTAKCKLTNKLITGGVEITKTDIATDEALSNCGIRICDFNGNVIFEGKTDKNGKVTFTELPYGRYTYQEYEAPEGYLINEEVFDFSITENGEIVKCKISDEKIPETGSFTSVAIPVGCAFGAIVGLAVLLIVRFKKFK